MANWQIIILIISIITGFFKIILKIIDDKSFLKKMDKINKIYPDSSIQESGDFIEKTQKKYYYFKSKKNDT